MTSIDRLLDRLPTGLLAGLASLLVALPLVLAARAEGAAAFGLVALGLVAGFAVGALVYRRWQVLNLPLDVAPVVVRGQLDGLPAYRFRVRLGRGRVVQAARAEVIWQPEDGKPVTIEILEAAGARVGPWTVVALDRRRCCAEPGAFRLRVHAEERGRTWSADVPFGPETVREGRFANALVPGRRVRLDLDAWDRVEP